MATIIEDNSLIIYEDIALIIAKAHSLIIHNQFIWKAKFSAIVLQNKNGRNHIYHNQKNSITN